VQPHCQIALQIILHVGKSSKESRQFDQFILLGIFLVLLSLVTHLYVMSFFIFFEMFTFNDSFETNDAAMRLIILLWWIIFNCENKALWYLDTTWKIFGALTSHKQK
jgi:hypothetical protein